MPSLALHASRGAVAFPHLPRLDAARWAQALAAVGTLLTLAAMQLRVSLGTPLWSLLLGVAPFHAGLGVAAGAVGLGQGSRAWKALALHAGVCGLFWLDVLSAAAFARQWA